MPRSRHAGPAHDAGPTDYGSTSFDRSALGSLSTVPAPWDRTEHAAFELPRTAPPSGRAQDTGQRVVERMITLGLLLVTAVVACVVFLFTAR